MGSGSWAQFGIELPVCFSCSLSGEGQDPEGMEGWHDQTHLWKWNSSSCEENGLRERPAWRLWRGAGERW